MVKAFLSTLLWPLLGLAIMGGHPVASTSLIAQHTVELENYYARNNHICTGTIIADDIVMTAAHCLGASISRLPTIYFRQNIAEPGVKANVIKVLAPIKKVPTNKDQLDWHDIALLKLDKKIPVGYRPVKLDDQDLLQDHDVVVLAGYGRTNPSPNDPAKGLGVLRAVEQVVLQARYGTSEILIKEDQKGACFGDSGGPAFIVREHEYIQVGLTSHFTSKSNVQSNDPRLGLVSACIVDIVYTGISAHAAWIKQALRELK